jgi:hypothetical protein
VLAPLPLRPRCGTLNKAAACSARGAHIVPCTVTSPDGNDSELVVVFCDVQLEVVVARVCCCGISNIRAKLD